MQLEQGPPKKNIPLRHGFRRCQGAIFWSKETLEARQRFQLRWYALEGMKPACSLLFAWVVRDRVVTSPIERLPSPTPEPSAGQRRKGAHNFLSALSRWPPC